jgi:hypothetical protein
MYVLSVTGVNARYSQFVVRLYRQMQMLASTYLWSGVSSVYVH